MEFKKTTETITPKPKEQGVYHCPFQALVDEVQDRLDAAIYDTNAVTDFSNKINLGEL